MSLLIAMLPVYLFGNLHCLGMCGPLVLMIGKHRYKNLYFVGRVTSFTLVAALAGLFGEVLHTILNPLHLAAFVSIIFGLILISLGFALFLKYHPTLPSSFS